MAGFSQKISNFVQGLSDQPDELKAPGFVKDAVNVFPDVTFGLLKRPGFKLVKELENSVTDGKWFSYYRQNNFQSDVEGGFQITGNTEEYLGNISKDGYLRMYDSKTGREIEVEYSDVAQFNYNKPSRTPKFPDLIKANQDVAYLAHKERQDLQVTTVNDFTFITNRRVFPKMGEIEFNGIDKYHAFIDISVVAYGYKYELIFSPGGTADFQTPTDGSAALDAEAILKGLRSDIRGMGYTCEIIGSGLYVESDTEFTVETPTDELFDILAPFSEEVEGTIVHWTAIQNVTELPTQCKDGLIVLVSNSDVEQDDIYLKFVGSEGKDGPGVWEETVKPGLRNTFDETTLPYQIVRQAIIDNDVVTGIKFVLSPVNWEPRLVGDEETNPRPSWAPVFGEEEGRPINKVLFFQNRLVTLSDENVVMSRSGDIFNFWVKTALTVSPIDPIDIRASNTYASVLQDGVVLTNGLVLFSPFQQFLVTTENDVLAPDAVKIRSLSSYAFSAATNPIVLGASLGFISEAGTNSRFYEIPQVFRDEDPPLLDNSRSIARRFPAEIEFIASSKEEGLVTFLKYRENTIYCFRYFSNGQERLQSAWFKFTILGEGLFHYMIEDKYYVVDTIDGKNYLTSMDLRDRVPATDNQGEQYFYRVNTDYREEVTGTKSGRKTTFNYTGPMIADKISAKKLYAVQGSNISPVDYKNNVYSVRGDWTKINPETGEVDPIAVGYLFEYLVEFPTFYKQDQAGQFFKSATASSLTLHRIEMNFGPTGYFKTILKRLGRDDYTVEYEALPLDSTDADELPYVADKIETVSIYDRNTNIDLFLVSEHPAPCTLWSATWEGDYTDRYYRRS